MRQPPDVFEQAVGVTRLQGEDDARVELPAALRPEALVGHLVGERVPEPVLHLGEGADLVEELRPAQVAERLGERLLGELGHRGQDRKRDVLADDRGGLEQGLLGLGEVPDPAQQDALHRVGHREVARPRRRDPGWTGRAPRGRTGCPPRGSGSPRRPRGAARPRAAPSASRSGCPRSTAGGATSWVANDRFVQGGS